MPEIRGGPGQPVPVSTEDVSTWRKYRKRPVVIEARRAAPGGESIPTLEGVMRADPGDYIVRGIQGELYPVKATIFEATYDAVG